MYILSLLARWSWPFNTPNQLGFFGVFLFVTALGVFAGYDGAKRFKNPQIHRFILGILTIIGASIIAGSTSRGALMGALMGGGILCYIRRARRRVIVGYGILIFFFLLAPRGSARINSIVNGWEDGSVANRFKVWKGALAMIWDKPASLSADRSFRELYSAWYQPIDVSIEYYDPLNDLLLIGFKFGLFGIWVFACVSISLLIIGLAVSERRSWFIGVTGGWVACLACMQFSGFLSKVETGWIPFALGICIIFYGFLSIFNYSGREKVFIWAKRIILTSTLFTFAFSVAAFYFSQRYTFQPLRTISPGLYASARGRYVADLGTILIVADRNASLRNIRLLVRGLAGCGFDVKLLQLADLGFDGAKQVQIQLHEVTGGSPRPRRIVLIGVEAGARVALAAAASSDIVDYIAIINAQSWFGIKELSPIENVRKIQSPLLVMRADGFNRVEDIEADLLVSAVNSAGGIAKKIEVIVANPSQMGSVVNVALSEVLLRFFHVEQGPGPDDAWNQRRLPAR